MSNSQQVSGKTQTIIRFTVWATACEDNNTSEGFGVRNKYFPTPCIYLTHNNIGMGDALRERRTGMRF